MARGGIEYEQTHPTTVLDALKAVAPPSSKATFLDVAAQVDTIISFKLSVLAAAPGLLVASRSYTGAIDSARLPRILTCVRCGYSEQFEAPPPNRLRRGQRALERARRRAYETGEIRRLAR